MKSKQLGEVQDINEIQIVVFVPSTKGINKKISSAEFQKRINEVKHKLDLLFGGETTIKAKGSYYSKDLNKYVDENSAMVETYAKKSDWEKKKNSFKSWVKSLKLKYGQESMGIIIENDMIYL